MKKLWTSIFILFLLAFSPPVFSLPVCASFFDSSLVGERLQAHVDDQSVDYTKIFLDELKDDEYFDPKKIFPDYSENDIYIGFTEHHAYLVHHEKRYDGGFFSGYRVSNTKALSFGTILRVRTF